MKHDERIVQIARTIYEQQAPKEHGRSPRATWAAAFYVAYQLADPENSPTQTQLAKEYKCSPVTLRNRRDDIIDSRAQ